MYNSPYTQNSLTDSSITKIDPMSNYDQIAIFIISHHKFDIITGFHIDESFSKNIDHITLEIGDHDMAQVRPEINGDIFFWENFQLRPSDFKFHPLIIRCRLSKPENDIQLQVNHCQLRYTIPINFTTSSIKSEKHTAYCEQFGHKCDNLLTIFYNMAGLHVRTAT